MLINWYPGHMNKARKKVKDIMPTVDLVIEVCDARLPFSSSNPMLEQLRGNKPFIKVLSKTDLADPDVTKLWLDELNKEENIQSLQPERLDSEEIASVEGIPVAFEELLPGLLSRSFGGRNDTGVIEDT